MSQGFYDLTDGGKLKRMEPAPPTPPAENVTYEVVLEVLVCGLPWAIEVEERLIIATKDQDHAHAVAAALIRGLGIFGVRVKKLVGKVLVE